MGEYDWRRIDALIGEYGSSYETYTMMTAEDIIEALLDRGRLAFPNETNAQMRARALAAELAVAAALRRPKGTEELTELWRTCPTIPMTPMPEYGYDPLPLILSGEKTHTLRGNSRRLGSFAEVTVGGERTGVILRITGSEKMEPDEYLTADFAWADGVRPIDLSPRYALRRILEGFYPQWGGQLKARWRLDFEVYRRPEKED